MVEAEVRQAEPVLPSERADRLERDGKLTERVEDLISKGYDLVYCRARRRLANTPTPLEWEHEVYIEPQEENGEIGKTPSPDWLKVPVLVEVFAFGKDRKTLQKDFLLIDFPGSRTAKEEGRPWVWSVNEEGEKDPTAPHRERTALASELLEEGAPVSEILKTEAEKLGLEAIRDLPTYEQIKEAEELKAEFPTHELAKQAGKEEEPYQDRIDEAVKAFTKTQKESPVLAHFMGRQILRDLRNEIRDRITEGSLSIDEILGLPRARLLTDPEVWRSKEIAAGVTDLLVGELRASRLEGEDLETNPVTKFLMERWGEDYVLHLGPDLLSRFRDEVKGEALVKAEREVRAKRILYEMRNILLGITGGAGATVEIGTFANTLLVELVNRGVRLPSGLDNKLITGGFLVAFGSCAGVVFDVGKVARKLQAARKREEILKKVAPPSAEEAVGESEGPVE